MTDEESRAARAAQRRSTWTGSLNPHTNMPPAAATPEARMLATAELSIRAHLATGAPLPSYTRATMPTTIRRTG